MIKTVFVGCDGSAHANRALVLAAEIAKGMGARLVVGHVLLRDASFATLRKIADRKALSKAQRDQLDNYEATILAASADATGMGGAMPFVPPPPDLLKAIGAQLLEAAAAAARKKGIKRVSTALLAGNPADAILSRAKKEKADLIVMGTRGLGYVKELVLGSVSHKISLNAKCACLTVK